MTDNDDEVKEGKEEIEGIEEQEVVDEETPTGSGTPILSLENMIKSALPRIDQLKEEIRTKKEMLDDGLNNDETYKKHDETVKEAAKIRNATKKQLMAQPSMQTLSSAIKDMRDELKELQASLSDYVSEYARLSGTNQIEDANGVVREIIYVVKLVKKK